MARVLINEINEYPMSVLAEVSAHGDVFSGLHF